VHKTFSIYLLGTKPNSLFTIGTCSRTWLLQAFIKHFSKVILSVLCLCMAQTID